MTRRGHKRLKIRLKATDREALAEGFGSSIRADGLFLPCETLLPLETGVRVELSFLDGRPALSGEGRVAAAREAPLPRGMDLCLTWDEGCRPLLQWLLGEASPLAGIDTLDLGDDEEGEVEEDLLVRPVQEDEIDTDDIRGAPVSGLDWGMHIPDVDSDPSGVLTDLRVEPAVEEDGTPADGVRLPDPPPSRPDLRLEPPVEEDGSPSEDLPLASEDSVDIIDDPGPPAGPVEDAEPILLDEVVEEVERSTQYAFSSGARDELGPSPAPRDAFRTEDVSVEASAQPIRYDREEGEVTPLARIELVRRSSSMVRAGELGPPPLEARQKIPPTAIPSKRHRPSLPPPSRRAMGIDPGSQVTRVAIAERAGWRLLPSRRGAAGVPSAVFIDPSGKTIVGEPAARRLPWQPELGIQGTKRLLGRLFASPRVASAKARLPCRIGAAEEDEVALSIGEHFISLEEIEALVLKEAREAATLALQDQVNRAVLVCPAGYGVRQRDALAVAGQLAGIHVERVLSTPLAVVLGAVREGEIGEGRYLVYDFGASAFDAAVVEVEGGHTARVVAGAGDPELGGAELDQVLADHVLEEVEKLQGVVPGSHQGLLDVLDAAELGKCALSREPSTRIHVEHPATEAMPAFMVEVDVRREEVEARFGPLVDRTFEIVDAVLEEAGLTAADLRGVFMVGGQSASPMVLRRARARFEGKILDVDRETAAVRGAAWAAAELESTAPFNLHERLPESLVVAANGGSTRVLLGAGATLPAAGRVELRLSSGADLDLVVLQGDAGRVERDEPVGCYRLRPPRAPEWPWAVALEVEVSAFGHPRLLARDVETGNVVPLDRLAGFDRARLGGRPGLPVPTPPHGLFERLIRALRRDDERREPYA